MAAIFSHQSEVTEFDSVTSCAPESNSVTHCVGLTHMIVGLNYYKDLLHDIPVDVAVSSFTISKDGHNEENEYLICDTSNHEVLSFVLGLKSCVMLRRCLSSSSISIDKLEPDPKKRTDHFIAHWIEYFGKGDINYRATYVRHDDGSIPVIYSIFSRMSKDKGESVRKILKRRSRLNDDPMALQALLDGLTQADQTLERSDEDFALAPYHPELRRSVESDSKYGSPIGWSLRGPIYNSI